jgi:hypothetical protein
MLPTVWVRVTAGPEGGTMEIVSIWIGVILGVIGILAAVAAMMRWFAHWTVETIVETIDVRIDQRFDERLGPINGQLVAIRHHGELVDLRLAHLEADMVLVKQHLLGSTAA